MTKSDGFIKHNSSVQDSIVQSIRSRKKGSILFISAFEKFGSNEAVRKALSQLQKKGFILRLSKGIYLYPISTDNPSFTLDQIAREVALRDKAHILPVGAFALHKLGLSSQIPVNCVYITDGSPRLLRIGGRSIKFKKGAAKNFAFKSELIYLIVSALRDMLDIPDEQMELKLKELLKKEPKELVMRDLVLAPNRIRVYLQNLLKDND